MSVSVLSGFVGSTDKHSVSRSFSRSSGHLVKGVSADCIDQDTADQIGYENCLKRHYRGKFLLIDDLISEKDFRDGIDDGDGIMCSCDTGEVEFCPLCDHPEVKEGELCLCNVPVELYEKANLSTKRKAVAYDDNGNPLSAEYCAIIVKLSEARKIALEASLSELLFER